MTSNRTSQNTPYLNQLMRRIFRLIVLGVGLGVITGTVLKAIALHKKNNHFYTSANQSSQRIFFNKNPKFKNSSRSKYQKEIRNFRNIPIENEIRILSKRWKEISTKQNDLKASAYLLLLEKGRYASLAPTEILPAASSIKIPILLIALEMIDLGQLQWNEPLTLTKDVIGGGAGWMAYQRLGKTFPTHEVATEMIRVSDNTATNLLIKRIGGIDVINQRFKSLGLPATTIKNLLPDLQGTNTTSAIDLAHSIAMVDTGQVLSPRTRDLFREVMSTSVTNRLLPAGLLKGLGGNGRDTDYKLQIKGYRIYNKTGDIGIAYSDAGLIELPDRTRAIAGFIVKGPFNDPRSPELIRKMAASMAAVLQPKVTLSTNSDL